jgi:hypothetical protein
MCSPLRARWFKAEHDARHQSIEAHPEVLDKSDINYEAHKAY